MSVATVIGVFLETDHSFEYINFIYRSHYISLHAHVTVVASDAPFAPMTDPRPNSAPYDMRCPIARTLDIVGERWTILILRDLVTGGSRKFQDFERSLAGISPNTLSGRLKRLEEAGIVERRFYEQHPPRAEYLLTKKGEELRPVLRTLFDWGQRHTQFRSAAK
jgi:DNA-binding HxlR family transcriptional regulator